MATDGRYIRIKDKIVAEENHSKTCRSPDTLTSNTVLTSGVNNEILKLANGVRNILLTDAKGNVLLLEIPENVRNRILSTDSRGNLFWLDVGRDIGAIIKIEIDNNISISSSIEINIFEGVFLENTLNLELDYEKGQDSWISTENDIIITSQMELNTFIGALMGADLEIELDYQKGDDISVGVNQDIIINAEMELNTFTGITLSSGLEIVLETDLEIDLFREHSIDDDIIISAKMELNTFIGDNLNGSLKVDLDSSISTTGTDPLPMEWVYVEPATNQPICEDLGFGLIGVSCSIKNRVRYIVGSYDGYSGCIKIRCEEV